MTQARTSIPEKYVLPNTIIGRNSVSALEPADRYYQLFMRHSDNSLNTVSIPSRAASNATGAVVNTCDCHLCDDAASGPYCGYAQTCFDESHAGIWMRKIT
ncbi:hypothetical protein Plhal304r1_c015g0055701 [Plasmopara halstedii]